MNCERLGLDCLDGSSASPSTSRRPSTSADEPSTARKKRTFRSCTSCRASKTKCDGDRPTCRRCQTRSVPCTYDAGPDPAWTAQLVPPKPPSRISPPMPVSPVTPSVRTPLGSTARPPLPARQDSVAISTGPLSTETQVHEADGYLPGSPPQIGESLPQADLQLTRTSSNPLQW